MKDKTFKGTRIKNFRYKLQNSEYKLVKLYLDDDTVVKIWSPFGLQFHMGKLEKRVGDKIDSFSYNDSHKVSSTLTINFKNGKKLDFVGCLAYNK